MRGEKTERPSLERTHELVEVLLRQAQLRYTGGRQRVVAVLYHRGGPISMADIEKLDPSLPRSSTYRHLVDLQAVGAVRAISANGEFTHFELAEDLTEHHHHIVCLSCGAIADVAATATFEAAMLALTKDITKRTGFVPMAHALDLVGHCATCALQHGVSTIHH